MELVRKSNLTCPKHRAYQFHYQPWVLTAGGMRTVDYAADIRASRRGVLGYGQGTISSRLPARSEARKFSFFFTESLGRAFVFGKQLMLTSQCIVCEFLETSRHTDELDDFINE